MCRRVTCDTCGKPSWAGCGMHVETVSSARRARVAQRCGPRARRTRRIVPIPAPASAPASVPGSSVAAAAPLPPPLRAGARPRSAAAGLARPKTPCTRAARSPLFNRAPGRRWRACRRRTAASASPARRRSRTRQASDKVGAAAGAAPCLRHPCRLSAAHCLQTPSTTPAPSSAPPPTRPLTDSCIPRRRQQQVCSPVSGTYY